LTAKSKFGQSPGHEGHRGFHCQGEIQKRLPWRNRKKKVARTDGAGKEGQESGESSMNQIDRSRGRRSASEDAVHQKTGRDAGEEESPRGQRGN